jgi:hypothetical protein
MSGSESLRGNLGVKNHPHSGMHKPRQVWHVPHHEPLQKTRTPRRKKEENIRKERSQAQEMSPLIISNTGTKSA